MSKLKNTHAGHRGFITTITSASTSLNYHWEVTWHMTLFCFFWHRFRGHGADSPCLPSLDTFPCHTGEDGSLHKHTVAGAPTSILRLQCSRSLVIVYTVTLDWLAAEQFCQNSERSYRLYSVQYSVQVYSAVYYWCTVNTWSLRRCTGMRSPHYGFVCKHRQGLLCMFNYIEG